MRVYVTGAPGVVGGHVACELAACGAEVCRERVDLEDRSALERALAGCDAVVHAAAPYSYDADPRQIELVNVTRNVVAA
jgi:nucleoside-diphosphate-sugar epimerase